MLNESDLAHGLSQCRNEEIMKRRFAMHGTWIVMLAAALLFSYAVQARADEAVFTADKITYTVTKTATETEYGEVTVTGSTDSFTDGELEILEIVSHGGQSYYVTAIGERAFYKAEFQAVSLPATVRSIGIGSFASCRELTSIVIPLECVSIGDAAFFMCDSLVSVEFYDECELLSIGNASFAYTSITEISLPDTLSVIDRAAFFMCDVLEDVYIGEKTDTIGSGAFSGCSALKSLTVSESNRFFMDMDNFLYSKDGEILVAAPSASGDITLPDAVKVVAEYAFENAHKLTGIELKKGVVSIGKGAFLGCRALRRVITEKGLETIGENAFYGCSRLEEINLEKGLEKIESAAFQDCGTLNNVSIPSTVKSIKENVFANCTSLSELSVSSSNKKYYSKDGMIISSSKKRLISYPSASGNVTLPEEIEAIGPWAFQGCEKLQSVILPDKVKTVMEGAFSGCTSLSLVRLSTLKTDFSEVSEETAAKIFYNVPDGLLIEIPSGSDKSVSSLRKSILDQCTEEAFVVTY